MVAAFGPCAASRLYFVALAQSRHQVFARYTRGTWCLCEFLFPASYTSPKISREFTEMNCCNLPMLTGLFLGVPFQITYADGSWSKHAIVPPTPALMSPPLSPGNPSSPPQLSSSLSSTQQGVAQIFRAIEVRALQLYANEVDKRARANSNTSNPRLDDGGGGAFSRRFGW
jgi:hypothetical protein